MKPVTGEKRSAIQGWHMPGLADELWYPIDAMRFAGVPVAVVLDWGRIALAIVRPQPRTRRPWWYQIGTWGVTPAGTTGWVRTDDIALDAHGRVPPSVNGPTAWRPLAPHEISHMPRAIVALATWRHPLPPPLPSLVGPRPPDARAVEPPEDLDTHQGSDDWPYPGLALGLGVPASLEECEARILRAFRTSASSVGGGIGHATREYCADIPKEMAIRALRYAAIERLAHGEPDADRHEAVRSGWTPTKRDIEDFERNIALGWLDHMPARMLRVLEMRAADPPFGWRQIAERVRGGNKETMRALYARAVKWAFASAGGTVEQGDGAR